MRMLSTRSSLFDHSYPPFYACYLLKSVKTPRSQTTYVGSTPHPPRRIRQHNGELTQGAWKTKKNRPWVMTMIVHGFPSKLAALQFEWAWQHPELSRHLHRGAADVAMFPRNSTSNRLHTKIMVVRTMISTPPYNSWPLHVKLFHPDAVKGWNAAQSIVPDMPQGFTFAVELEGVDGKSGDYGSGRKGPIDVKDAQLTEMQLAKHCELMRSASHECSVCHEAIDFPRADHLTIALCSHVHCSSISHLRCLSRHFLASGSSSSSLIPRGGPCPVCAEYTLWGDIVRGCYRRRTGGYEPTPDDAGTEEDELVPEREKPSRLLKLKRRTVDTKLKAKPKATSPIKRGRPPKSKATIADQSEEEIEIPSDIMSDVTSSELDTPHKKMPARGTRNRVPALHTAPPQRKSPTARIKAPARVPPKSPRASRKGKKPGQSMLGESPIEMYTDVYTSTADGTASDYPQKEMVFRKRLMGEGTAPLHVPTAPPSFFSENMLPAPTTHRKARKPKASASLPRVRLRRRGSESGEEIGIPLALLEDSSDSVEQQRKPEATKANTKPPRKLRMPKALAGSLTKSSAVRRGGNPVDPLKSSVIELSDS